MNTYIKLLNNLEELGLKHIRDNIDYYLNMINTGDVCCKIKIQQIAT